MKPLLLASLILVVAFVESNYLTAGELDARTKECIEAFQSYVETEPPAHFKTTETITYEGLAGNADELDCKYPVIMTLTFEGSTVIGSYYFKGKERTVLNVRGTFDDAGHLLLKEMLPGNMVNYEFRGVMKNGEIRGLWEKGEGKKAFAFYAREIHVNSSRSAP